MKLTYWVSMNEESDHYNLRERTRKACLEARFEATGVRAPANQWAANFGPVHKVTVEFKDSFDLLTRCLGEGGHWE